MTGAWRVGVVVPARDEEDHVVRCLDAIDAAIRELTSTRPGVRCDVVVVLDRCTDRTAELVAARPGVLTVDCDAGLVGDARARGVQRIAAAASDPHRTWIACTDADSVVPRHWLSAQLDHADDGHEMVVGLVGVDPAELDPEVRSRLDTERSIADGHPHIYGANLGFTLAAYQELGGFEPLPAHEDVTLVQAARRARMSVHASGSLRVLTSARLSGRTPHGFASHLRELTQSAIPPVA